MPCAPKSRRREAAARAQCPGGGRGPVVPLIGGAGYGGPVFLEVCRPQENIFTGNGNGKYILKKRKQFNNHKRHSSVGSFRDKTPELGLDRSGRVPMSNFNHPNTARVPPLKFMALGKRHNL